MGTRHFGLAAIAACLCLAIVIPPARPQAVSTAAPAEVPGPATPPDEAVLLHQGAAWDGTMRAQFHFTPQGSRLMPRAWFLALERAGDETRFAAPSNLARFGFLYASGPESARLNPAGLPIGFAVDPYDDPGFGSWVGLNCAACHTGEVTANGARMRIEGAPAMLDFGSFGAELNAAVQATLTDEAKRDRFLARAARPDETPAALHARFAAHAAAADAHWTLQRPTLEAGPGRVDALGQILNTLSVTQLGEPGNARPPNAPTSYPFLWTTPWQDWVQWVPIAGSPLARNVGQVLGVFGHAELVRRDRPHDLSGTSPTRFASTARIRDLDRMEAWLRSLEPPAWPAQVFGAIDRPLAEEGRALVARNCLEGCHTVPPNWRLTEARQTLDGRRFIQTIGVPLAQVGTDATYAGSLGTRRMHTGALADLFEGRASVTAGEFLGGVVGQVTLRGLDALNLTLLESLYFADYRLAVPAGAPPGTPPQPWGTDRARFGQLKAGPLVGLWATGPFLHNGSVPTIDELLRPPAERRAVFWVGSRELDLARLGFVADEAPGLFRFDTSLPGNRNVGHAYPSEPFTQEQRRAVIEYLKDPGPVFPLVPDARQ